MIFSVLALWTAIVAAQAPPPTGRLVERVACPSDPTQTYTLYLPSGYSAERKWPLLFVFDPRGRGTVAAGIFSEAAERYGWIVASSNNTQSDGEWEPNRRAVAAMWPDVRAAYAVDERRIYAAGFSGGASLAWVIAANGAPLAGIIASGGPDLPDVKVPGSTAWFGAVGRADFNYLPVRETARRFERAGARVRLEHFDGPHRWLPTELASRAIGWFEAVAMGRTLRGTDTALLEELARHELAQAEREIAAGWLTDAARTLTAAARDYTGTVSAAAAARRLKELSADPRFGRVVRLEKSTEDDERRHLDRVLPALQQVSHPGGGSTSDLMREMQLDDLVKAAAETGYRGASAGRTLETIFVQVSFYVWRELEKKGLWSRAAVSLELALAIHADRPRLWVDLAAARAMQRQTQPALEALKRAADLGYAPLPALASDPRFTHLDGNPAFTQLVRGSGDQYLR